MKHGSCPKFLTLKKCDLSLLFRDCNWIQMFKFNHLALRKITIYTAFSLPLAVEKWKQRLDLNGLFIFFRLLYTIKLYVQWLLTIWSGKSVKIFVPHTCPCYSRSFFFNCCCGLNASNSWGCSSALGVLKCNLIRKQSNFIRLHFAQTTGKSLIFISSN